jgi:hypothetical protein
MGRPPLNLGKVIKESSPLSPLIFVITGGIDRQDEIIQVGQSMEADKSLKSYWVGRGGGAGAEIEEGSQKRILGSASELSSLALLDALAGAHHRQPRPRQS